ncbi:hypothetical protein MKX54_12915 [Alkalihalobacillus sp. FSL R5-0424]
MANDSIAESFAIRGFIVFLRRAGARDSPVADLLLYTSLTRYIHVISQPQSFAFF